MTTPKSPTGRVIIAPGHQFDTVLLTDALRARGHEVTVLDTPLLDGVHAPIPRFDYSDLERRMVALVGELHEHRVRIDSPRSEAMARTYRSLYGPPFTLAEFELPSWPEPWLRSWTQRKALEFAAERILPSHPRWP